MSSRPALPAPFLRRPVIAILRRLDPDLVPPLVDALVSAGVGALELTVDSDDALGLIGRLRNEHRNLAVGAGTVLDIEHGRAAIDAGASFLVCPHTDPQLISFVAGAGLAILPGAATATEAWTAWSAGAAAVKLFPAGTLGLATLRALREPLPHIAFVAVGGISGENAGDFLDAGAVGVGIASWLTAAGDAALAARRAGELVAMLDRRVGSHS